MTAPTTIFERMSARARATGAINLGQGFPDLPEPPELIEAAARALRERSNQYPPMRGLLALREAVAAYYAAEQGLAIDPAEVIVTSGATEALAASLLALVRPGDEVILVQPLYDAYLPLVRRAGGTATLVDLIPPDWRLPIAALRAAIGPRTRLLVLNSPNNPAGACLDEATLEAIAALAEAHDLLIVCDEVWEATRLDGRPHLSPMALPALRERTVKIGSAGKIFSLTGWKIGWACAAPPLAEAVAAQHQYLTFTTPTPLQWAVADGLALPGGWYAAQRARYAAARDRLVGGLTTAGYRLLPSQASWFVIVDIAASGLPMSDEALCERLVAEAGVASIPVSAFYAERPRTGYLRLCFAKEDAVLDAAVARLAAFRNVTAAS
jgi:aspartate/methionine/tyrosine aminotransferase